MGSSVLESAQGGLFGQGLGGLRLTISGGLCYVEAAINGQSSTRRAHARDLLLRAQVVTALAEWNQWTTH